MASVTFKSWKSDRLLRKLPSQIMTDYGPRIAAQCQQEIAAPQYRWDHYTKRKSGQEVRPGLRNIVDLGGLIESQTDPAVTEAPGRVKFEISWPAQNPETGQYYSRLVQEGGYLVGTTRNAYIAPERDWIKRALAKQSPMQFFVARWKELFGQ